MAWAKFDDRWATHPKLLAAGLEAKGLDASGICYAAGQETDGFVPDAALIILAAGHKNPAKVADVLVAVGRWWRDDERKGYHIHDYGDYNFTRSQGDEKRAKAAARKAEYRAKQGRDKAGRITSGDADVPPDEEQEDDLSQGDTSVPDVGQQDMSPNQTGHVSPVPTRPDPTPKDLDPSPNHLVGLAPIGKSEMDRPQDQPQPPRPPVPPDPLLERLLGVWPGRNGVVPVLAKQALAEARRWLDDRLLDEVVGHMLGMDPPPATPRYLLTVALNWAEQRGAGLSAEAIASMRAAAKSPSQRAAS